MHFKTLKRRCSLMKFLLELELNPVYKPRFTLLHLRRVTKIIDICIVALHIPIMISRIGNLRGVCCHLAKVQSYWVLLSSGIDLLFVAYEGNLRSLFSARRISSGALRNEPRVCRLLSIGCGTILS
jgi:hypothetical protein